MKHLTIILILLITVLSAVHSLDINGDIIVDMRLGLSNGQFLFNQESLALKFEHSAGDNLYAKFQIDFLYINGLLSSSTYDNKLLPGDIGVFYMQSPFEIAINEAYFTYSDFLIKKLDLTVGKQRITWGTADQFNPTDILNPTDLSDPFDFGKKMASLAINAQYYLPFWDSSIQVIYEPYSQVARLNSMFFEQLETELNDQLLSELGGANYTDNSGGWTDSIITVPEWALTNGLFATKFAFSLAGFDFSVNFATRANDFPTLTKLNGAMEVDVAGSVEADITATYVLGGETNITTNSITTNNMSTNISVISHRYELGYGRELEIGLDFSKDFDIFLLWGELGIFISDEIPNSINVNSDVSAIIPTTAYITEIVGIPILTWTNWSTNNSVSNMTITSNFQDTTEMDAISVSNEVYFKYVIGMDKSFDGGWYANFQFVHGLFNERGTWGPTRLQDYFILVVQKNLLSDKLVLTLAGMYNINNFKNAFEAENFGEYVGNHYGVSLQFAAAYSPIPDLKIELGILLLDGINSSLGYMKDYDMVFTKFTYTF